jgi:hypothetical protein
MRKFGRILNGRKYLKEQDGSFFVFKAQNGFIKTSMYAGNFLNGLHNTLQNLHLFLD